MVGLHVSVVGGGNVDADITYHLQVAARAFYSNKGTLLDKNVSANLKLELFDATVTPIACFAAGHCSIRQHNLHILDVEIRGLVRSVVPRPSGVCWSRLAHEILHVWNARVPQVFGYTPQIEGADCAVSSLDTGDYRRTSTQSLGETRHWHGRFKNLRGGSGETKGNMLQRAPIARLLVLLKPKGIGHHVGPVALGCAWEMAKSNPVAFPRGRGSTNAPKTRMQTTEPQLPDY